jgi:hypothetical protein
MSIILSTTVRTLPTARARRFRGLILLALRGRIHVLWPAGDPFQGAVPNFHAGKAGEAGPEAAQARPMIPPGFMQSTIAEGISMVAPRSLVVS